jgi:hypothetical protein
MLGGSSSNCKVVFFAFVSFSFLFQRYPPKLHILQRFSLALISLPSCVSTKTYNLTRSHREDADGYWHLENISLVYWIFFLAVPITLFHGESGPMSKQILKVREKLNQLS